MKNVNYSLLELATLCKGKTATDAIVRATNGAQHIDQLGYTRIWLAEHHNMEHIASSATSVLIGHIAGKTKNIRVGSGGIMLPNHAPLVIAEQFGTLESMYPGRIDLGLGRAPGTDQITAMALRRNNLNTAFYFKDDVLALERFFSKDNFDSKVRAFPGEGLEIPIWILGSSTDSAYLAAELGLPYAFAAHFAPNMLKAASDIYRQNFKPSKQLQEPYFMVCVNIIAADTNEEAEFLSTSLQNLFAGIVTNRRMPLSAPTEKPIFAGIPEIEQAVYSMTSSTFTGNPDKLAVDLKNLIRNVNAQEIMTTNYIFDDEKRLKAFDLIKNTFDIINQDSNK
ncbi:MULTISPECIES: LLM class flavin-dependent oxidoreductase [Sphingobacterium]|jgi:luciferase family oxidoreductase group 1|uniref:LLM class flavin-dependent oxidoreductase n=1 Tax=Sphingobacterium TaxID=28453 RepID=UPI000C0BC0A4|nr:MULTISPECIES: LLM class flavin-dependent oxidoreductase [Sphingobacterium]MCT1532529.1 LLM class flavin-dependent oxidoreductase [Sphingobacterium daejeonense]